MSTAKERLRALSSPNAYSQSPDKTDARHSVSNVSKAPVGISGKPAQVAPVYPTAPDADDFAERAAVIEHDGGIIQPLADCLAAILTAGKPLDMPPVRWLRFQTDAALLVDDWGAKALALGWSVDDLLGVDVIAPWQRIDRVGLAWLLNGDMVTAIDGDKATISTAGTTHTFTRRKA